MVIVIDNMLSANDYLALLCDLITGKQTYYFKTDNLYNNIDGNKLYEYWN